MTGETTRVKRGDGLADEFVLALNDVTKVYPGVIALNNVTLGFYAGEIHAIVGENGAGKSTFIKILTGAVAPDSGTISVQHSRYGEMNPHLAHEHGIECIYQELNLIEVLSAAENICYGKRYGKLVDYKAMNKVAQDVFDEFGINIEPSAIVRNLSSAQKQIVEISKSITKKPRILILDEPTSSLTVSETAVLMKIINRMKVYGVTVIFISHRLEEIFQIADRVSVFRDGHYIVTLNTKETSRPELIKYMVGRELSEVYPQRLSHPGRVCLELRNLTGNGIRDISFKARAGEVLGVAGLVGAGRSEIMKVVFGAEQRQWGAVYVHGKKARIKSPRDAMTLGIGLIPEDRKKEGCFLRESVSWNIVYNVIRKISKYSIVDRKREKGIAESYANRLRIKTPTLSTKVLTLSGGNQQKVVVAKTLASETAVFIFDEPTKGIDVGAKWEIYELINGLCAEGKCIIMITSDMEELLGMSDRIVVFAEHRMAGELKRKDFSQEAILELASGGAD